MAKKTNRITGLDEAGRGPLAGPVVAAAVRIKKKRSGIRNPGLKIGDSKKITAKRREELYRIITAHPDVDWGAGVVSEKVIDKINVLEATKRAMKKALKKISGEKSLIIDGNFKLDVDCKQRFLPKGDETILECSMASIIAKVERDRIMAKYHRKYPFYGFDKHKGYGTKNHRKMIKKHGICPIHRRSFKLL